MSELELTFCIDYNISFPMVALSKSNKRIATSWG